MLRSTFAGFNTMVSGIQSSRLSLDTVGHNISNSATEGYSRQSVNLAATRSQTVYNLYGQVQVGTGVDSMSLTRARDIYADRQYWKENGTSGYYDIRSDNYSKLETIFNDSDDNSIQNSLESFYTSWSEVSTEASVATSRQAVINEGQNFAAKIQSAALQLQEQINSIYEDMKGNVTKVNSITDQITDLNSNIMTTEVNGASANDLRDQRDLLVDELSNLVSVNVYEDSSGMYTIVSNGTTLVNGVDKLDLEMSDPPISNPVYGISDYALTIKQTDTGYIPSNGEIQSQMDSIAEDKEYLDYLSNIAAFCLTSINAQHRAGAGIDDNTTTGINFYGEDGYEYTWDEDSQSLIKTKKDVTETYADGAVIKNGVVTTAATSSNAHTLTSVEFAEDTSVAKETMHCMDIIDELVVNQKLTDDVDGERYLASRSITYNEDPTGTTVTGGCSNLLRPVDGTYTVASSGINGTADGTNAVLVSNLFNCKQNLTAESDTSLARPIGSISLYSYYNKQMTTMGTNSENMSSNVDFQDNVMEQISNLRDETSGVNWDEELSNMIMFQQGYSACSRCLTTMDEMLDKLVNSTGTVGR